MENTQNPQNSMAQPPLEPLARHKHLPPKIWVPVLAVVAFAVAYLGIASAYSIWPFDAASQLTPTLSPPYQGGDEEGVDELAGWQTYRNQEFGFEVKYPNEWSITDNNPDVNNPRDFLDIHIQFDPGPPHDGPVCNSGFIGLEIQPGISKDSNLSFESFVNQEVQADPSLGVPSGKVEKISLGEHEFYRAENSGWESGCTKEGYLVEEDKDSYTYVFSGYNTDRQSAINIINKILSTFKFIEPQVDTSIYRNQKYGFEIKYPKNLPEDPSERLCINEGRVGQLFYTVEILRRCPPDLEPGVLNFKVVADIDILENNEKSLDNYIKGLESTYLNFSKKEFSLNNVKGYKVDSDCKNVEGMCYEIHAIILQKPGTDLVFELRGYTEIISDFKFIN